MVAFATKRFWGVALAVFLATGCGSEDPTDPGGNNGNGGGGGGGGNPVQTTSVSVVDNSFNPSAIQVSPGATVTFTWSGSTAHNVIWVGQSGLQNSPTQVNGTFTATMPTTTGEIVYFCNLHGTASGGMRGTIRIQ